MTTQPVLKELMARVREAKGPLIAKERGELMRLCPWRDHDAWLFGEALGGSLDAAVGLVERVRPGIGFDIEVIPGFRPYARLLALGGPDAHSDGATPALALLAALLSSLLAQEAHADD